MPAFNSFRRIIIFVIAASFIISSPVSVSDAQRRARNNGVAATQSAPHHYKQLGGTTHPRSPRTYDVQNYKISTRFDVPNKAVIGDETVTLKPLAAGFRSFELDASDMQIEAVTLAGSNVALPFRQPPDKLSINLDRAYGPADSISVRIRYRARPQRGLYFIESRRGRGNRPGRPAQIWTQGEPEDNHHWFPCYDFPDDKATTEQYVTTGANEIAISNGALVETTNNPDGTRTFHWVMDQPYSSYLVSLVVGDYAKLTGSYRDIPLEYYTYHGTEAIARRSFSKTPEMMQWFSRVLDYDYPYNKYSQAIVANFIFGGMENITATTHADTEILRPGEDDPEKGAENLVSHELSHSWFGNLVTANDWANLWLNEGFATFMEASFKEHDQGRDAYLNEMRANAIAYFSEDPSHYRRAIVYDRYRTPVDLFDNTLYKKGGFIVHMLRETVGDDLFWKALNTYLNQYKYRNVVTADLQRVFEQTARMPLDWFFDQWVYKAGYPELRVRSSYDPATRRLTLYVRQTQMPDATTPSAFRLPVEIELATAQGKRAERIEITKRAQHFSFQLDGKPLMIRFDKGERILKKLDFPQSAAMLSYQLLHSADAVGRIEAAEALARMLDERTHAKAPFDAELSVKTLHKELVVEPEAIKALREASTNDPFYGVRERASSALARYQFKEMMAALVIAR